MTSQLLTDTQKLAEDIVTAIEAHAEEVDAGANAALKSELRQGERAPAAGLLLRLAGRRVHRTITAYAAAEAELDAERADDVEPRAQRDAHAAALYAEMKKVKGAVESLFGPSVVRSFQLPADLPRDPAVLAQAAQHVVGALGTHKLPAPQVEGVGKVDAAVWIELLRGPLGRLKTARAKVNLEDKQLAAALDLRDRAFAAANEAMVEAVQLARALARLADKDALFDRLRATPAGSAPAAADDPPADPAKPPPPAP
jgi:hypothetical protein